MDSKFNDLYVFIRVRRGRIRHTGTQKAVKMEAEIGPMQPQAEDGQGWPAASRSSHQKRGMMRLYLRAPRSGLMMKLTRDRVTRERTRFNYIHMRGNSRYTGASETPHTYM